MSPFVSPVVRLLARASAAAILLAPFPASLALADEPPPLAGPKVPDPDKPRSDSPSIVSRDFDGKMRPLDNTPVAAALAKLDLDEPTRKAVDDVLAARARDMDAFVRDNLQQLALLKNAKVSGDREGFRRELLAVLQLAKPITDKGPLVEQVASVLPPAKADQLRAMVKEHARAKVAERMDDGGDASSQRPAGRFQAIMAEQLGGIGEEIKAAYERTVKSKSGELDRIGKHLNLTPEQESKIQQAYTDLFQKTLGKPTRAQRLALFSSILSELTPEQKRLFAQLQRREAAGAPEADTPGQKLPAPTDVPTPPAPPSSPPPKGD